MKLSEMEEQIRRVEIMAKRGLLTAREAEQRITQLIDETLVADEIMSREKYFKIMEQRRLADRRKWKFLLSLTKEKVVSE